MKIDIKKIKIREDLYPRFSPNTEAVLQYRMNVDNLPPITLTKKDNTLIDGYHRLIAHRDEGKAEIEYEYIDIPENEYFLESLKRNSSHGLQLSRKEKEKACTRLYKDWIEGYGEDIPSKEDVTEKKTKTSKLLAVSKEKIRLWTQDIISKVEDTRKQEAWELWLACKTEDEIAESVNVSQDTVNKWIKQKKQGIVKSVIFPESLQIYNIWNVAKARTDNEYPGRLPLDVMENILYYFTEPFDIVLDPMAGGGTTVNSCKKMTRRYVCYDLVGNPLSDIYEHNILEGLPKKKGFIPNLIFLDPPYWKQMERYTGHKENLANLSLDEYFIEMDKIIKDAYSILREDGVLAIIVSPTQLKHQIYDLQHKFYLSCEKHKFEFVNRIIVPYQTQQVTGAQVAQAKEGKYLLKLYRDLLIFRKNNKKREK